ncbi:MAG: class I SAM-dependent methyltransferase [Alphaproteobacteria bacterium]
MNANLKLLIQDEIKRDGPMRLDRFMGLCNAHYYASRDPLGRAGDFVTAPEVSQMFGEVIGAWAAQAWMDMGSPSAFVLLELGPGRGTLMADMLRAVSGVAGFAAAARVHLVETSPVLRAAQGAVLKGYDPQWHDDLGGVPDDLPIIVVANEFFDALPVRQEVERDGVWQERLIAVDLTWNITPLSTEKVREVSPAREVVMAQLAQRMARGAAAGLVIDYGHAWSGFGDTFQAVKAHEYVDPLMHIGEADLTSHVDFEVLARVAADAGVHVEPLMEQGAFLKAMGVEARAAYLKGKGAANVEADLARLIAPEQMGKLFKVMVMRYGQ